MHRCTAEYGEEREWGHALPVPAETIVVSILQQYVAAPAFAAAVAHHFCTVGCGGLPADNLGFGGRAQTGQGSAWRFLP